MCGIVALWGSDRPDLVNAMLSKLTHRGPDGRGIERLPDDRGVLGHRRLAIIDPAGGYQPMRTPGGESALIVNGMIYNYRDLRDDLEGAPFVTDSDSETILHGYTRWGTDVVERLDGMFAFVLTDGDRLIAARDPLGIKPLYVGEVDGGLAFASEINALAGVATGLREFPAGQIFDSERGFTSYYSVPEPARDEAVSIEDTLASVWATLEASVLKRLRSDVPLGCFLSGGLDSSLIAAIARQHVDELHTFSVGLEGSSDLGAAREVARHLGTIHHERVVTRQEALDALPDVVRRLESFDRDLVRNAVPTWFVAWEAVAAGMKVILTGEGADELFAGYRYYADYDSDPDALQHELRRSLEALHDMNLQRVDRMTMAHGLEARVPFLDTEMVALAMRIDPRLKRPVEDGQVVEKWVLRKACEDLLPESITWRTKAQFAGGSGFADVFADHGRALAAEARGSEGAEESAYRDILGRHLSDASALSLTSHWRDNRVVTV